MQFGQGQQAKAKHGYKSCQLLFRQGLCLEQQSANTPAHPCQSVSCVSSPPCHSAPKSGKNFQTKTITLIMWELLLSPSSQLLDFPDYFLQFPFDKSAQPTLSLTFFPAPVIVTTHFPACAAPLKAPPAP